jgi:hypothetical protein
MQSVPMNPLLPNTPPAFLQDLLDSRWQVAWAEETAQLKDYGDARQITLFEHGQAALKILTSDSEACPADILSWLKSRWREENFLK